MGALSVVLFGRGTFSPKYLVYTTWEHGEETTAKCIEEKWAEGRGRQRDRQIRTAEITDVREKIVKFSC